eukprot:TRINITY_DN6509_c0_g1_i1.p1 TRINITY_DN6509_c0_g1~~TRINITY_DN6509_c0_g1_i1.p1  ORF type:complete len:388 (-),score=87.60 TRINITY_DN6509_c0_g1_i1:43-1206(-)
MESKKVVICGGGVIGTSIAYYLSLKGIKATVVERCSIACAASGKAGGFLALEWCDSSELGVLARKSFKLHEELALTIKADWGYRKLDTLSLRFDENTLSPASSESAVPWINVEPLVKPQQIGTTKNTAQVHPALFTHALIEEAKKNGAEVRIGTVEGLHFVERDGASRVGGVKVGGEIIPADVVVIAMGPWSSQAADWLPKSFPTQKLLKGVSGLKAHSIVLKPQNPSAITPHALFLECKMKEGEWKDPEVYPRPNGDVYICGYAESSELPVDPSQIVPREGACKKLHELGKGLSKELASATLQTTQACFLPVCSDLPLIGEAPESPGLFVATGHSCWGILNAPATGLAVAELIADGASKSVDLSPFSLKREGKGEEGQKKKKVESN